MLGYGISSITPRDIGGPVMGKVLKDKNFPLAGKTKSHGAKRLARIKRLAQLHNIELSTVIGRGLHLRRPRKSAALVAVPAAHGIELAELRRRGLPKGGADALDAEGLTTVGLITSKTAAELLALTGFGDKSLGKLRLILAGDDIKGRLKGE